MLTLEYLSKFKDVFPFCIPCGDCWTHAPSNPFTEEMIAPPYLKCPAYETNHYNISYALRGINAMANAVYNKGFPITPEVAERVYGCYGCGMCSQLCWTKDNAMPMVRAFRTEILEAGFMPTDAQAVVRGISDRGHPWRGTKFSRIDWARELNVKTLAEDSNVDIVYWVGCTAALEERNIRIAKTVAKLLHSAGINFGILGSEESCCGEPAFWLGEEYLFQSQAEKNIEALRKYKVKRIFTTCPHCFNVLKNEYPKYGADFEVVHHTQYLAELVRSGKIKVQQAMANKITYHDPCFLGRYNDVYEPPREILGSIPDLNLVEMKQHKKWSFCCGGGGGHMWLQDRGSGGRPNIIRTEQAIETEAEVIATSCPFCLQQFDDAVKTKGVEESIRVMDIAELLFSVL